MAQKTIPEDMLVILINSELRKHDECCDCKINGIMKLQETDEKGCNWSEPSIQCSGVPATACAPLAYNVISSFREKYNIE